MGNSPPTPTSLRLGNGDRPYQVQLGRSAALYFTGREVSHQRVEAGIHESWKASYKVGESTCDIKLAKVHRNIMSPHPETALHIEIDDDVTDISFNFRIYITDLSASLFSYYDWHGAPVSPLTRYSRISSSTTNARGGITVTWLTFFEREQTRLSLIVCEWIKKSKDEDPYMGTVAHYYVNTENGEDIGLSITLKRIRVSNDGLWDFSVDGPEEHPVDALHYMFKQVRRTVTWKPSDCPHCAKKYINERQSESESDIDNNVVSPWPYGRRRNPRNIVSNDGKFKGNNNANTFINKFYGRK